MGPYLAMVSAMPQHQQFWWVLFFLVLNSLFG
jgi:hypothetical protein